MKGAERGRERKRQRDVGKEERTRALILRKYLTVCIFDTHGDDLVLHEVEADQGVLLGWSLVVRAVCCHLRLSSSTSRHHRLGRITARLLFLSISSASRCPGYDLWLTHHRNVPRDYGVALLHQTDRDFLVLEAVRTPGKTSTPGESPWACSSYTRLESFDSLSVRVTSLYRLLHSHICELLDSAITSGPAASCCGPHLWTFISLVDASVACLVILFW